MSQNESNSIIEQWREGIAFSDAWFVFGDPFAVTKFREARTRQFSDAQRILMVADLWQQLNSGQLIAIGKCVAPKISAEPILIPTDTFEFRPLPGIENSDDFEISGCRYEGVKICRPADTSCIEHHPESPFPVPATHAKDLTIAKRGGGRRNRHPDICEVLSQLFDEHPAYIVASPAELLEPFNNRYVPKYSTPELKRGKLSERSLRDHLCQYRQESAETGNSQSAN